MNKSGLLLLVMIALSAIPMAAQDRFPTSDDGIKPDTIPTLDVPDATAAARGYALDNNVPNPFVGSTTITFILGKSGPTRLTLYNELGVAVRTLVDDNLSAGTHTVTLDAADLPNGSYLYRLVSGSFMQTRTMALHQ